MKNLKNSAPSHVKTLAAAVSASLLALQLPAQAQDDELSALGLEEVVVTAQKRAQSVQDIGFSVNAFDSKDAARYSDDVGALAGQSPSVESFANNTGIQSFFIRGIGLNEFASNFNQPVAVHKDEVYVSKNWMTARPTFDVERIEILKGPQGTLFGRNTTGGAINYYHATPSEELEGYVRAKADEHSRYSLEGAVSGGITDSVSGRLSMLKTFGSGGPQENLFDGEDHGEPDMTEIRGQLQWENESTLVRVMAYAGTDESELTAFKNPGIWNAGVPTFCEGALTNDNLGDPGCFKFAGLGAFFLGDPELEVEPADVHTINQNLANARDDEFSGAYLRIEHDLTDSLQIVSLTSYDEYDQTFTNDSDGSPIVSADSFGGADIEAITQELRLVGSSDLFEYVAGVFYSSDEQTSFDFADLSQNPFGLAGGPTAPPAGLRGDLTQKVDSLAVFANGDINLSDALTLTLGLRYTKDETELDAITTVDVGAPFLIPISVAGYSATEIAALQGINPELAVIENDERTDENVSGRIGLSYDLSDTSMIYGNLVTGFRTGGYSIPFGGAIVDFEPEEVTSFELGYKADLSNTVRLNVAAFYYEYDDLQVNVDDRDVSLLNPVTKNIGTSETFGLEADLTWLLTQDLELKLGYSYLDSEYSDTDEEVTTISNLGAIPLEGKRPINTPENQFNGALSYATDLTDTLGLAATMDFRWTDDRFLEVTNQPSDAADAYSVFNASVGLFSPDGTWDVSLWVRNLTDEEYLTYINNVPGAGFQLEIYGERRTAGVTAEFRF